MEQFVAVAAAHFVALLVPGVDFFLVSRTAAVSGRRSASGVCLGIAVANGVLVAAAFWGLSLITEPVVLLVVQLAGGAFLAVVGTAFVRSTGHVDLGAAAPSERTTWARSVGLGLASGLLNPKNALFYASLASAVAGAPALVLLGYGVWMVSVVLLWDLLVATVLGSPRVLARLVAVLPWLTRGAGVFLVLFGVVMVATALLQLAGRT